MSKTQSVDIPKKKNNEATLKERMTENAYENILPARYLVKNEDGGIIESQEELFERVAKNIALAEVAYVDESISINEDWIRGDMDVSVQDLGKTITEDNVNKLDYDKVVDDISDDAREEVEFWKKLFEDNMSYLNFIPNTPTLINAGTELQQLSACFVNSPDDDMRDIHDTAAEAAEVFQSGGGMGYSFSSLRPYGDAVGSTGGIASGPITFMRTYDQLCETIAQGGARRGAQMGVMNVSHPDIIRFIHAKNKDVSLAETLRLNDPDDYRHTTFKEALDEARELISDNGKVPKHLRNAAEGHLSNFNISVGITENFMDAVKNNEEFYFTNPRTESRHIATEETKELYECFGLGRYVNVGEELSVPATEIWDRIIEGAYENGEPGVIYLDRVNKEHSFDVEEHPNHRILATNPCGEQPLEEYEACNLGHINLSTIVDDSALTWKDMHVERPDNISLEDEVDVFLDQAIDWHEFNRRIDVGVRFLENVVTMSKFPIEEIEEKVSEMRKIGLGVMGLAQLYIQLGVEYGSEEGNEIAKQLMTHINHTSKQASHEIATDRGNFGAWEDSKYSNPMEYPEWFEKQTGLYPENYRDGYKIRNHNTTTIAPTGTTSMIGNTSGGCEPIYNVAYYKNVSDDVQGDEMLVEFDDYFLRTLEANDIDVEKAKSHALELMENNNFDGASDIDNVPDEIADLFITTSELSGKEHASVLCACQEGVDSSISKTCNFPKDATKEDMKEVYEYIYDNGGKSVTVYRDGTRSKQVMTTRADNQGLDNNVEEEFNISREDLEKAVEEYKSSLETEPRARPDVLTGQTYKINTSAGGMYVTINEDDEGPFEVFAEVGKSGGYTQSHTEAIGRLISYSLRIGGTIDDVVNQLKGIRAPEVRWDNGDKIQSVPDGVAVALERYNQREKIKEELEKERREEDIMTNGSGGSAEIIKNGDNPECRECGSLLVIQEGCKKCSSCGWSQC